MKKSRILTGMLALALSLVFVGCDVVASGGAIASPLPTLIPTPAPLPGASSYLFSSSGTLDITSTIDNWSSGSSIDSAFAAETYNPCIKVTSSTGWGGPASAIAFTAIAKGKLAEYTTLNFKAKSSSYTQLSVKIPAVQKDGYLLSGGTALTNGWVQMSIPLSDFGAVPAITATELGILNATAGGSFYITDVCLSGTATVDISPLTAAITTANTLNTAHPVGAANGNVPLAAKNAFTAAIATAQTVASGTPAAMSVVAAAYNALASASSAFTSALILIGPSTLPASPGLTAGNVISLFNSSSTYTNISGISWNPGWGQGGSLTDTVVATKTIKWLAMKWNGSHDAIYQGVDFAGNPQNISTKNTLHISYWTADGTDLSIYPINSGGTAPHEYAISAGAITQNGWHDIDILINQSGFDLTTIQQLKFTATAEGNFYLDNIYFH